MRVYDKLCESAARFAQRELFVLPGWLAAKWEYPRTAWTYGEAATLIEALAGRYRRAGYSAGHRVALLCENRLEHFFHWLALNSIGASAVPVNPDYRDDEMRYLFSHSEAALAVAVPARRAQIAPIATELGVPTAAAGDETLPRPAREPTAAGGTECALLYTSGTTGRPKGCMLSNEYFLGWGEWYTAQRGYISLSEGGERLLQPLPTFHVNAMGNSFIGMLFAGGAQVILDRFHPRSWWQDAIETRATCFHYLGVMPAMLLNLPPSPLDRAHALRFGMGGGVHPAHHAAFEQRFGVPLLEGWAMTETGGAAILCAAEEPRHVGGRCIGRASRPGPPLEIRLVDDGELLVRARGENPRRRFFSGYYKDDAATETIWAGGWLHTGDVVRQDADGGIYFVDRKKNIIRRSGENIAAVEVESVLASHPSVAQVAVLAVLDEIRGEEVMAVIAPRSGQAGDAALAEELFGYCRERLAYYKAPGYVAFVERLPTTSTQKVRKVDLGELAEHPERHPGCFDLRTKKQQSR